MTDALFEVITACRRSRIKLRAYAGLVELQQGVAAELADIAHTSPARVVGAMMGDGREFSFESGLVTLGVAEAIATPRGLAFKLTPRGAQAWPVVRSRVPRGRRQAPVAGPR